MFNNHLGVSWRSWLGCKWTSGVRFDLLQYKDLPIFKVQLNSERASLIAQLVKNPRAMQETPIWFLCWEDPLEQGKATHSSILGLPCGSAGKESAFIAGDLGSIPGLGRCPGEGKGYPLQYSGLDNSMDCIVHGVAKSWTRLSDFHFLFTITTPTSIPPLRGHTKCPYCPSHC